MPSRFSLGFYLHLAGDKNPIYELKGSAEEFRERDFNRLLLPVGERLGSVIPLAHHLLYPTQVVETPRNRRPIEAIIREAKVREADGVLVFSKKDGWSIREVSE